MKKELTKITEKSETLYFNKMWTLHTDSGNATTGGLTAKNIYLGDTRIVTKLNSGSGATYSEENAKQYFYHSDHLGSASLISDKDGNEYQRIEYTPYGETWVEKTRNTGLEWLPYKFIAKEMDEETGLYYYGARYLDPKYSRWLSTDPALGEYVPGVGKGTEKEAGSLPGMGGLFNTVNGNLYHYAGNNPVKYTDPTGLWTDNGDGSFTAQKGDTLWGLQQETGRDWSSFDYQGKPESLQIGQTVNVVKTPETNSHPTIDSTTEAVKHYYNGNGEPVNLGDNTINALKNSPEQRYNQKALSEGTAKSETHRYGVDLTNNKGTFHVGDTVVTYDKSEGTKYRVVTYNAFVSDGFWDVLPGKGDWVGPKKELPGGTPYSYIPYSWTEVYKK